MIGKTVFNAEETGKFMARAEAYPYTSDRRYRLDKLHDDWYLIETTGTSRYGDGYRIDDAIGYLLDTVWRKNPYNNYSSVKIGTVLRYLEKATGIKGWAKQLRENEQQRLIEEDKFAKASARGNIASALELLAASIEEKDGRFRPAFEYDGRNVEDIIAKIRSLAQEIDPNVKSLSGQKHLSSSFYL